MDLTPEERQKMWQSPPEANSHTRSIVPGLARNAVSTTPHGTLPGTQWDPKTDQQTGPRVSLRRPSFVSWSGIFDTSEVPASAPISNCDLPSHHHRRSDAPSWCTATESSALSSASISIASVRPYNADKYAVPDEDEVLGGSDHFEAFDGGPYFAGQEAEVKKLKEEVKRLKTLHDLEGMDSKRTLRSKKSQVLERPWTSMSRIEDEGPKCRYERRMRCRADVEEEYWRQVMVSGKDEMEDEREYESR